MITKGLLILLVAAGLWSGAGLSWHQFQSGDACPMLGRVPACYIAFASYLAMAVSLVIRLATQPDRFRWLFWIGLGFAGGLATLGTVMEVIKGGICPKAFGVLPMCYVSLAICVVMGILFVRSSERVEAIE